MIIAPGRINSPLPQRLLALHILTRLKLAIVYRIERRRDEHITRALDGFDVRDDVERVRVVCWVDGWGVRGICRGYVCATARERVEEDGVHGGVLPSWTIGEILGGTGVAWL